MRLRAQIKRPTGATKHYRAHIADNKVVKENELAVPAWVEIHSSNDAFLLLYFDASGVCMTDTWHATIDQAKTQAQFEFMIREEDWERVAD